MSFMQKTAFEQIENHQLEKILDEYRQSRHLFKSIYRAIILILSLIFAIFLLKSFCWYYFIYFGIKFEYFMAFSKCVGNWFVSHSFCLVYYINIIVLLIHQKR